ncbi:MAG TPA: helix-turn-helix transcriptional regulator [Thermoanaerobaculia bacterium]|nr:helix-turn-helix transcriptional regulator [Thermoanaerobaculia bacterium]
MDWRDRLRDAVNRSGKKHSYIAEDAGVTRATLSRILTGKHRNPGVDTIVRIAHAVGESVGWIFGEQGFSLSGEQRAKIQTAAVILIDLTRGDPDRLTSLRAAASRSRRRR